MRLLSGTTGNGNRNSEITLRDTKGNIILKSTVEMQFNEAVKLSYQLAASYDLLDAASIALRELRGFYSDHECEAILVLKAAIAKAERKEINQV